MHADERRSSSACICVHLRFNFFFFSAADSAPSAPLRSHFVFFLRSRRRAPAALEQLSVAAFSLVLVVLDDHLAAREHRLRLVLDAPAFEEAVVAVHVVRLGAERALDGWVE